MSSTIAFIRKNKNNLAYQEHQIAAIKSYVLSNKISLTSSIQYDVNTPKEEKDILQLLKNCTDDTTLLISNLHVFGRTIEVILDIVNNILKQGIKITSIEQNFDLIPNDKLTQMILAVIGSTLNLEKDLMSLRTKEALLAKKLDGINLGKPKGTIQKSKFDDKLDKIKELLALGLSVRKIAKQLGYNNHIGLNNYINKRNIKQQALEESQGLF